MPSIKLLAKEYSLDEDRLLKIIYECFKYHLSEDELEVFIYDYYHILEMRLNKRYQR